MRKGCAGRRLHRKPTAPACADILAVGRKLPKRLLEDSPDIYDFVDIAEAKADAQGRCQEYCRTLARVFQEAVSRER